MKHLAIIGLALGLTAFAPQQDGAKNTPNPDAGRKAAATETVDSISSHLIKSRCWTDHSDMADARRLQATFRVWIGRDGRFSRAPERVRPSTIPADDAPMQTFVAHASNALKKCNELGWPIPADYFEFSDPPLELDIEFLPKIAN
jgi:hypothetical protein